MRSSLPEVTGRPDLTKPCVTSCDGAAVTEGQHAAMLDQWSHAEEATSWSSRCWLTIQKPTSKKPTSKGSGLGWGSLGSGVSSVGHLTWQNRPWLRPRAKAVVMPRNVLCNTPHILRPPVEQGIATLAGGTRFRRSTHMSFAVCSIIVVFVGASLWFLPASNQRIPAHQGFIPFMLKFVCGGRFL